MSANNYLKIDQKNFTVSDCDADTDCGSEIGKGKTLEEAIDIADKYGRRNMVEYGIRFTGKKRCKPKGQQLGLRQKQSLL